MWNTLRRPACREGEAMTTQRNNPQCWAGSSEKPGCVAPRLQAELSAAQSALADKEREVERLTEERDSFERVGIATEARAGEAEKVASRYRCLRSNPNFMGWEPDFLPNQVDAALDATIESAPPA